MKLPLIRHAIFILSIGQSFAGTPLDPNDQENCLKRGLNAPGLMRVEYNNNGKREIHGSAVLISAESLGLPELEGRLFASVGHIFKSYLKEILEVLKENSPISKSTSEFKKTAQHIAGENFFLSYDSPNVTEQSKYHIQKLFSPKSSGKKSNAADIDDNDVVFGILSEPVKGLQIPNISPLSYEDVTEISLVSAGFGFTHINKTTISDNLARAGDQVATAFRGKNCFIGAHLPQTQNETEAKLPIYSETGDSGGAGFVLDSTGNLSLLGIIIGGLNATPANVESILHIDGPRETKKESLVHYSKHLDIKCDVSKKAPSNALSIIEFQKNPIGFIQSTIERTSHWISEAIDSLFKKERNQGTVYLYLKDKIEDFVAYFKAHQNRLQSSHQFELVKYSKARDKTIIVID